MNLLETLLPSVCVACKKLGRTLCLDCLETMQANPRSVDRGISGWSAIDYEAKAITAINAFKEHGKTSLLADFCALLDPIKIPEGAVLVGLPSSAKSTRVRGFVPGELLASRLARRRAITSAKALSFCRTIEDQSSLGRLAREANLRGSMVSRPIGSPVYLVDDVVTTGASMREAARAMAASGNDVLGFITIAETILKIDT